MIVAYSEGTSPAHTTCFLHRNFNTKKIDRSSKNVIYADPTLLCATRRLFHPLYLSCFSFRPHHNSDPALSRIFDVFLAYGLILTTLFLTSSHPFSSSKMAFGGVALPGSGTSANNATSIKGGVNAGAQSKANGAGEDDKKAVLGKDVGMDQQGLSSVHGIVPTLQ